MHACMQENPDDQFGTAGTDQIFSRDYSAPTGEDLFDKSTMPKIMQVRLHAAACISAYGPGHAGVHVSPNAYLPSTDSMPLTSTRRGVVAFAV